MDRTQLILMLMDTPGIGERTLASILRRMAVLRRESKDLLSSSTDEIARDFEIKTELAEAIKNRTASYSAQISALAKRISSAGIMVVTLIDASYPRRLMERMPFPPPVLFAYGNTALLDRPLVAIANSNGADEHFLALGDRAVEAGAAAGWSLVTGHNRMEYQRPALAAKRCGMGICYVLDRGIIEGFGGDLTRDLFPAARIWGPAYDPLTDLTISTFGPLVHGNLAGNRKRDELVFALADTVFAGHIKPGGVMEKQCLAALERGGIVWVASSGQGSTGNLEAMGGKRLSGGSITDLQAVIEEA